MKRVLLATFLVACAHHASPPAAPSVPAPALAELDELCGTCHDGAGKLPRIDATLHDRELALRSALFVSARRMPPPPAQLADTERVRIVAGLCRVGADDPKLCERTYAPASTAPLVRSRDDLLRAITQSTGVPGKQPSPANTALEWNTPAYTRVLQLDTTLGVLLTLVAAERCAGLGKDAQDACVARVYDPQVIDVPAPRGTP